MGTYATTTRFLRSLDGIFYSLLAFAGMVFYETFGVVTVWAKPSMYTVLPLAAMFLATLHVPLHGKWPDPLKDTAHKLKILSLALVGFYPFVPWHVRGTTSIALTAGAWAALFFGTLYLLELLRLMNILFSGCDKRKLAYAAHHLRVIMHYVILLPVTALYSTILMQVIRMDMAPSRLLRHAWTNLHPAVRILAVFIATACPLALLFLMYCSRPCTVTFMEHLEKETEL